MITGAHADRNSTGAFRRDEVRTACHLLFERPKHHISKENLGTLGLKQKLTPRLAGDGAFIGQMTVDQILNGVPVCDQFK
jgi:hypothetical protein